MDFMEFGERLKLIRGSSRQDDFATKVGFHKNTIGRWERGEQTPNVDDLNKILAVFPDINPTWLLTGKGWMRQPDFNTTTPIHLKFINYNKYAEIIDIIDKLKIMGDNFDTAEKLFFAKLSYDKFYDSNINEETLKKYIWSLYIATISHIGEGKSIHDLSPLELFKLGEMAKSVVNKLNWDGV
jgi:transcriptional regulator with XRE-family HTH domain